jgi:hypothetical protein
MFAGVWDAASGKVVVLDKPPLSRAASDAPSTTGEKGRALQNLKDTLGTKERKKEKYILGRARPALLSLAVLLLPPPIPPRSHRDILPTLVSLRKVNTAGVALLSPNMTLTDGATGPLFSHSLLILFHMTRAWPAQAGHLATRWNLDWRSPVSHHQHLSESILCILSRRYDPIAAWPERNW